MDDKSLSQEKAKKIEALNIAITWASLNGIGTYKVDPSIDSCEIKAVGFDGANCTVGIFIKGNILSESVNYHNFTCQMEELSSKEEELKAKVKEVILFYKQMWQNRCSIVSSQSKEVWFTYQGNRLYLIKPGEALQKKDFLFSLVSPFKDIYPRIYPCTWKNENNIVTLSVHQIDFFSGTIGSVFENKETIIRDIRAGYALISKIESYGCKLVAKGGEIWLTRESSSSSVLISSVPKGELLTRKDELLVLAKASMLKK